MTACVRAMIRSMTDKKTILVVDDDRDTVDVYRRVLEEKGFAVEPALDGAKGLELAKKGGYALILLDLMMPNVDGLKVLTELAASPPATPNGSVIVFTNLSHDPVIAQAMALGAKACFVKSDITPDKLVEKITAYL